MALNRTPMGSGFLIFFHTDIITRGGDDSPRRKSTKRNKIYRTKEIYALLQAARKKVKEAKKEPTVSAMELAEYEQALLEAEIEVRDRLAFRYLDITKKPVEKDILSDFVSGVRFGEDIDSEEDMEQILLILLIDEWTDGR